MTEIWPIVTCKENSFWLTLLYTMEVFQDDYLSELNYICKTEWVQNIEWRKENDVKKIVFHLETTTQHT